MAQLRPLASPLGGMKSGKGKHFMQAPDDPKKEE